MLHIYFDRKAGTVDGVLTIKNADGTTLFNTLARSGQLGYTTTSWTRGKSPIPYGKHLLWTDPVPLQMEPVGTPFFKISTGKNKDLITHEGKVRQSIGLHMENKYPGSAGCIVIVDKNAAKRIFDYIKMQKTEYIPLTVQ